MAISTLCNPAFAAYEIPRSVIAGGGGTSSGGIFAITGTIGQNIVAVSSGGSYALRSGFWASGSGPVPTLTLDVDLNGSCDALTDGLLILRYLFGVSGFSLTIGAIGQGAQLMTPDAITQRLVNISSILDIDDNNQVDAQTDGLLIIRYLFGLRGNSLVAGATGPNANRALPGDIETHIQSLVP